MTELIHLQAKVPPPLIWEGNVADNYKKFKQLFDIYAEATGVNNYASERRVAVLLNLIGEEGVKIFNNFQMADADKKDYAKVIKEFEQYC
ncbi:hypothetical protein QE152_g26570 [Popillia japonica]|uniref:Uncharacterized protein n=1 Tax=Popillia japonica TaxID=7064 RepID=A0AAW1JXT1_POPJA